VRGPTGLSPWAPVFPQLYVNDMVGASGELGFVRFAKDTNLFAEGGDPMELF
jgi:hypothetical protein